MKQAVFSESPEKSSGKRKKPIQETELSLIEDEGNTTDEFRSPPIKVMRLAVEPDEDSFLELLPGKGELCESGKNENSDHENRRESKWSCSTCTFLNHGALPYCEMCSSAKLEGTTKHEDLQKNSHDEVNSSHKELVVPRGDRNATDCVTKDDFIETSETTNKLEEVVIQGCKGKKIPSVIGDKSICLRKRKYPKPHEMSESENEESDEDTFKISKTMRRQEHKSNGGTVFGNEITDTFSNSQSPGKNVTALQFHTHETSAKSDSISTIESIDLYSDNSQSHSHSLSKNSLLVEEYTDTDDDDAMVKHGLSSTVNESATEADNEVTLIEDSDTESSQSVRVSSGQRVETSECTPKRQLILEKEGNLSFKTSHHILI